MKLHKNCTRIKRITLNETIMNMAMKYVQIKQLDKKVLQDINFVQKKKRVCLPCELVGMNGKIPTEYYNKMQEQPNSMEILLKHRGKNYKNSRKDLEDVPQIVSEH